MLKNLLILKIGELEMAYPSKKIKIYDLTHCDTANPLAIEPVIARSWKLLVFYKQGFSHVFMDEYDTEEDVLRAAEEYKLMFPSIDKEDVLFYMAMPYA